MASEALFSKTDYGEDNRLVVSAKLAVELVW